MSHSVEGFSDRDVRQTDVTALPYTKFREVHNYDLATCQITSIVGWGFGDLLPVDINPNA
jgi:hypothetical protein